MAQIIRGTQLPDSQGSAQISPGAASSIASGFQAIGNVQRQLGEGIASDRSGQILQNFGAAIGQQAASDMAKVKSAIDSSVYSQQMVNATTEFNQLFSERSQQVTDKHGNPMFTSLVDDVGTLGQEVANKYVAGIKDPLVRQKFLDNFNSSVGNSQIRALSIAQQQQKEFSIASYQNFKSATLNQAMVDGVAALPLHLGQVQEVLQAKVAAGEMSPEAAQNEINDFNRQVRMTSAHDQLLADPDGFIELLKSDPASLGLGRDDVFSLAAKAVEAQSNKRRAEQLYQKALVQEYKYLFDQATDLQTRGKTLPLELTNYMQEVSKQSPELAAATRKLVANDQILNQFNKLPAADREQFLQQLDQQAITNPDYSTVKETLMNANEVISKQEKEDPIGYLRSQGMLSDIPDFDPTGDVVAQLDARANDAALSKAWTGEDSTGLDADTAKRYTNYLKSLDEEQFIQHMIPIFEQKGVKYGETLLRQLNLSDKHSHVALKASYIADGQLDLYRMVAAGESAVKNKTSIEPKNLESEIAKYVPKMENAQMQQDIMYAMKMAYLGSVYSKDIDEAALSQIARDYTNGGSIDFNGSAIVPSVYGESIDQFQSKINRLTPKQIDLSGGISNLPSNVDPTDVIKRSRLINAGQGQYFVMPLDPNLPMYLLDKKGQKFVLDMNLYTQTTSPVEYSAFMEADTPFTTLDKYENRPNPAAITRQSSKGKADGFIPYVDARQKTTLDTINKALESLGQMTDRAGTTIGGAAFNTFNPTNE